MPKSRVSLQGTMNCNITNFEAVKDILFLVERMEPALSSTSFEIPAVFACRLAGKKCGNFKTG